MRTVPAETAQNTEDITPENKDNIEDLPVIAEPVTGDLDDTNDLELIENE